MTKDTGQSYNDRQTFTEDSPDAVSLDFVDGDIKLEQVSFRYEENQEAVLSHVNQEVKPGESWC